MNEEEARADARLEAAFEALDPGPPRVERMKGALLAAYAPPPSLAAEWLTLLRARPVANTILTLAAAAALLLAASLGSLPWALLSEL